jgi:competence ComEA-like helix-hairpin-helix protein
VLKPYIVIDEEYAIRPKYNNDYPRHDSLRYERRHRTRDTVALQPFMIDTASAQYLYRLGFSRRQAEVIVRYVKMLGGLRDEEELRDCYVISDSMADRILPYVVFDTLRKELPAEDSLVEINSADTAALRRVYGIGEKSAAEIVHYRELLGGYYSVEQLCELKCITERNYERFFAQICCDSCKITKIDINFASPKSLMRHPYISSQALRRIVKQRQLKGGWSRIEEMVEQNIFTEEEAKRLAPYLRFRLRATE